MDRRWLLILGIAVIVIGLVIKGAAFTILETEHVIVMQFGEAEEGLHGTGSALEGFRSCKTSHATTSGC